MHKEISHIFQNPNDANYAATRMTIGGFEENSFIDWEGNIASVVFISGCNFRCPFCHNRQLVLAQDTSACVPLESVLDCLDRKKGWIDAVVLSGGEPTAAAGIYELCELLKRRNIRIKLDTNGSLPHRIEELGRRGLIDAVSMDVKAGLTSSRYEVLCGVRVDTDAVKQSIGYICRHIKEHEFRTTVVPGLSVYEDVRSVAGFLRENNAREYVLQRFIPRNTLEPELEKLKPENDEAMREWLGYAKQFFPGAKLRGDYAM